MILVVIIRLEWLHLATQSAKDYDSQEIWTTPKYKQKSLNNLKKIYHIQKLPPHLQTFTIATYDYDQFSNSTVYLLLLSPTTASNSTHTTSNHHFLLAPQLTD